MKASNVFFDALVSSARAPELADVDDLFGFLIGSWDLEAVLHDSTGQTQRSRGELHAAWVLEGRAIQDVWTLPGVFVGSTLRVYDPGIDAWHILWSDPLRQYYNRQTGRRVGDRIVQEGTDATGSPTLWSFLDMAADRFRWLGERRAAEGAWETVAEFAVQRS